MIQYDEINFEIKVHLKACFGLFYLNLNVILEVEKSSNFTELVFSPL